MRLASVGPDRIGSPTSNIGSRAPLAIPVEPAIWVTVVVAAAAVMVSALLRQPLLLILSLLLPFAVLTRLTSITWAALLILVTAALTDHFNVPIAGINLRPEWIAGVPVLAAVAFTAQRQPQILRLTRIDLLLSAWLVLAGISSLLFASHRGNSLKIWLGLALAASGFFLVRPLVGDRVDRLLDFVVGCGFLICLFGLFSYLIYPLGFPLGVQINPDTQVPTVYATLWEGDIFGAFAGCLLLLSLGRLLLMARPSVLALAVPVIALAGLEVSLARAAWLGTLLAGVLMVPLWLSLRRRRWMPPGTGRRLATVAVAGAVFSAAYWTGADLLHRAVEHPNVTVGTSSGAKPGRVDSPPVAGSTLLPYTVHATTPHPQPLLQRLKTLTNPAALAQDPTVELRISQAKLALQDWLPSPWLGRGAGSFGQRYEDTSHHPAWIANILLRVLHDTGVLGLLLMLGYAIGLLLLLLRMVRREAGARGIYAALLLPPFIVLWVSAQATEPFQLMWPWIFLGLILAIPAAADRVPSPAHAVR